MNNKTLIGLAAAAGIAVVGAIALNLSKRPQSESSGANAPTVFAPVLRDHINEVNRMVVTGAEDKPLVTLQQSDKGWVIAEKSGYPADLPKLREFLLKLSDATVIERKTSNKDKYADLAVNDVSDKTAKGVQVELGGLPQPLKLIVGNYNGGGGGGTFMRRAGEAESWLVKGTITVEKTAAGWLKKELSDIQAARLKEVLLTSPDGKSIKVYKEASGDANFKIADVPKGREPSSEFVANALASPLAGLRFEDVDADKDSMPGDKIYKAHYLAFDGVTVDVTSWEKDGKPHARFVASLDATQHDAFVKSEQAKAKADYDARFAAASKTAFEAKPTTGADDEPARAATALKDSNAEAASKAAADVAKPLAVSDAAKDVVERHAAVSKEVEELNKTITAWTYVLPAFTWANMHKSMDELLKPLEAKKPDSDKKAGEVKPAKRPDTK